MEDRKARAAALINKRMRDTLHTSFENRKGALERCRTDKNSSMPEIHRNAKSSAGKLRITVENVDIANKHNLHGPSHTTKNEESKKRIYPHQVIISRNFDIAAYRERLGNC